MRIACPNCSTVYNVDDAKIPPSGANLRCAKCRASFPVMGASAPSPAAQPVPLPEAPPAAPAAPPPSPWAAPAVPLPTGDNEPTRPGTLFDDLFGSPPAASPPEKEADPFAQGGWPPAPPSDISEESQFDFAPPDDPSRAVPLPSAEHERPAIPPPSEASVPLPAPSADPFSPPSEKPADPLASLFGPTPAPPEAPPAPRSPTTSDPFAFDAPSPASQSSPFVAVADALAFDAIAAAPAPADPLGFGEVDFGAPPLPATPPPQSPFASGPVAAAAPPPPPSPLGYGDLDLEPSSGSPGAGDLSAVEVGLPASPADVNAFAAELFGAPGSQNSQDGLALGAPPRSPFESSGAQAVISPLGGVPAPRPTPAPAASGELELLDFIDDGAPAPPPVRYQIRRKSGKVFGPFEVSSIASMLEQGQLLGNEDLSVDGESWVPMATLSPFSELIARQLTSGEEPAPLPDEAPVLTTGESKSQALERMKALYGDRMAALAIVDAESAHHRFKRKLPLLVGAGLVLVALGIGLYLGFTPYGFFGMRWLFPRTIKEGSAAWVKLREANAALGDDTWASYRRALSDAEALLIENDAVIESRALFVQAVAYLNRRFGAAEEKLGGARKYLEELKLSARDRPDVVKAQAGLALVEGNSAPLRALLETAAAARPEDPEFLFLLAESYLEQRSVRQATEVLKRIPNYEKSAKALHALGRAQALQKQPDWAGAHAYYLKALEAAPKHLSSAIEAAAIELNVLEKPDAAQEHLSLALADEAKDLLAPNERARALYLQGSLFAGRQELEAARKSFEEALKLAPRLAEAKAAFGWFLLKRREYERASELFEGAYREDPKQVSYLDGLVRAMIGASKLHTAAKTLVDASALHPGNPRIAFLQGRVADEIDRAEEAERNYKRALAGDESLWEADYYLGRLFLRRARFEDAKAAFEKALEKAPQAPEPRVGLGNWWLANQQPKEAKAQFKQALELDAGHAGAHFGLAKVLHAEGALAEAKAAYEQVIALDPATAGAFTAYGTLLWETGKLEEAAKAFENAKTADAKDPEAVWKLGAVLFELEKHQDALRNLETALALAPDSAPAHYYKARVHHARHENVQAVEAMKSALERAPDQPEYRYWMGNVFHQAQQFERAFAEWQEAVRLRPKYADAIEAMGRWHQEMGQVREAIAAYERAFAADPKRVRLLGTIGDCLFQQNRYAKAIERYQQALRAAPRLEGLAFKIGRAYNEEGKLDKAIAWYQKAAREDSAGGEVWRYLGYAYKERGRFDEAIKAFEKYLANNENAWDAKDIRTEIYDLEQER